MVSLAVGAVMALGTPARAEDSLRRAQDAFDQAQVDYLAGKYDQAAEGFQRAYEARPFPTFLFNIAVTYQSKGKAQSDIASYQKAIEYYHRYIGEDSAAQDKPKVEKRIKVLEAEVQRLKAAAAPGTPPPAPSESTDLADVKVKGLMVIESEPQGATIYIDGKTKGSFAQTPWSGSLSGEHTYLLEKRGYKSKDGRITPDPTRLLVLQVVLAEEDYLGWVEIKSNVPGADIYVDSKDVGAIGKTPFSGNFRPGRHKVWITAEGYGEFHKVIEVVAGETQEINAPLKGAPVGYLNLRGSGIESSQILIDGKVICERGPCRRPVQEGVHTITVRRSGYKTYEQRIEVQAKTETAIKVALAEKPSRADAIVAGILAIGFAGGGLYLGNESKKLDRDLRRDIEAGDPPVTSDDPRFLRGKVFAIAADGAFALAGVTALTAIYYTFRDKGPSSTATHDIRALALTPQVSPGYAGVGMEVRW